MKTLEKNSQQTINVENLIQHPYHQKIYGKRSTNYLESSIERTGNQPVNPIVVVPDKNGKYWVISGMIRLEILYNKGIEDIPTILYNISDEEEIKSLIVDLNKARIKNGKELLSEFRHYLEKFPQKKGVKGSRYDLIGKELNIGREKVKDLTMLNNFFYGDGDIILESVFAEDLSMNQANHLKKVIETCPENFSSESYVKLCNRDFDFKRLEYAVKYLNLDDESEFEVVKDYLLKNCTTSEFHKTLVQLGKVMDTVAAHEDAKVFTQELSEKYTTKNAHIIHGDNTNVNLGNPFGKKIMCLIGSPPYGDKRLNSQDPNTETGHNMNGEDYGRYLAETYELYIPYMESTGSVYVIMDDFKTKEGDLACSLEYFVVEMKKIGFHLVSRIVWEKYNPVPTNYKGKNMTNSVEFVYRFSLDPQKYYTNPNLYIEAEVIDDKKYRVQKGSTNHDNKGNTTRGGNYVQSHLKKLRNTLTEQNCVDVIKGNVANPEDFFRQANEKRHTSTAPIYLTSTLIMDSTKEEDLCVDIWNGVGNTMVSALLLNRQYVGIEKEENYYRQTVKRLQRTEKLIDNGIQISNENAA